MPVSKAKAARNEKEDDVLEKKAAPIPKARSLKNFMMAVGVI
jgi:hypothetical protein